MKGHKTGGRTIGTPNVITKEVRNVLKAILMDEIEKLPSHLENMEPQKRVELITKLMPYVLPKVDTIPMERGEPVSWDL